MSRRSSKKDFNKEQMYQKIMPSLGTAGDPDDYLDAEPEPEVVPEIAEREIPCAVNLMEPILWDMMEQPLKILRCCDCGRCKNDIIALALNQLPAKYAILEADEMARRIVDLRAQYEVKAKSALIQAIQQVKANPRH